MSSPHFLIADGTLAECYCPGSRTERQTPRALPKGKRALCVSLDLAPGLWQCFAKVPESCAKVSNELMLMAGNLDFWIGFRSGNAPFVQLAIADEFGKKTARSLFAVAGSLRK